MDVHVREMLCECSRMSDEGSKPFGELVMTLIDVGVERYHADLVRSEKTYHLTNGESEVVPNEPIGVAPAAAFSAKEVEAAVRAVQAGSIRYKAFCEQVLVAGCVGYIVSMAGRRVVYYGRTGDSHVEWFPGSK
jgi:uncharacterized protein YbcV (DUF1398 family)